MKTSASQQDVLNAAFARQLELLPTSMAMEALSRYADGLPVSTTVTLFIHTNERGGVEFGFQVSAEGAFITGDYEHGVPVVKSFF